MESCKPMWEVARTWLAAGLLAVSFAACPADPPQPAERRAPAKAARAEGERGAEPPRGRAAARGEVPAAESWGPLRVRRLGDGDGPVVVLLHGFGAEGDDLVGLARGLKVPEGTRFVLPEAPVDLPRRGRAWWRIDRGELLRARVTGRPRDLSNREPEGLAEARRAMLRMLSEASRRLEVPVSEMVLAGFSQGAMAAMDAALHASEAPAAVAVLSGAPLAMGRWEPRLGRLRGVPVLVTHGRGDRLLSFEAAERLAHELEAAGAEVAFVPFQGGHAIPPSVRSRLAGLIDRVAAD
ncbi:MAG: alpha/beta hydrolase [Myxococcota bacterium]